MEQFLIMRDICAGTATKTKFSGCEIPAPTERFITFYIAGADIIGTRAAPEIIDALGYDA